MDVSHEQLMKNLIDHKALKVTDKKIEAPTHGFNYEDWVALLDDEDLMKKIPGSIDGLSKLRSMLINRSVNPDRCVDDVLETVHDYIDSHTIGAKVEMAASKLQNWFRKLVTRRRNSAATKIQRWYKQIILNKRS